MLQEEYRALNAQLTANVAVAQSLRRNTAAAARSASEALSLLNEHRNETNQQTPRQPIAVPIWKQGPPLPVPEAFNIDSRNLSNVSEVLNRQMNGAHPSAQNLPLRGLLEGSGNRKGSGMRGVKVLPEEKVLEAAMHDMEACGDVSVGSEVGRRVLEVRRAAWEAQIACVKGR